MVQLIGKNPDLIAAKIRNPVFQVSRRHGKDFVFQHQDLPHLAVKEQKDDADEESDRQEETDEQKGICKQSTFIIV